MTKQRLLQTILLHTKKGGRKDEIFKTCDGGMRRKCIVLSQNHAALS